MTPNEVPHLSAKCWKCGDSTSMPPRCAPVLVTRSYEGSRYQPRWRNVELYAVLYTCTNATCYGATVGYYSLGDNSFLLEFHAPRYNAYKAPDEIPDRPRKMLQGAGDSLSAPVACVSASVRAVEAMLAEKGYRERKIGLMGLIKAAVADGHLPGVMADWALEVREIGTDTHTDEVPAPLPSAEDARRAFIYAKTLAEYLFEMPAVIARNRARRKKPRKAIAKI